jgi:hypothetical protein
MWFPWSAGKRMQVVLLFPGNWSEFFEVEKHAGSNNRQPNSPTILPTICIGVKLLN